MLCSFVIFCAMAMFKYYEEGRMVPTQEAKYPPTIYYLSYSFFALNALYLLFKNLKEPNKRVENVVIWLSSNSLWIYLWHIFGWYLWGFTFGFDRGDFFDFLFKFFFIMFLGIGLTSVQLYLVKNFVPKNNLLGRSIHAFLV